MNIAQLLILLWVDTNVNVQSFFLFLTVFNEECFLIFIFGAGSWLSFLFFWQQHSYWFWSMEFSTTRGLNNMDWVPQEEIGLSNMLSCWISKSRKIFWTNTTIFWLDFQQKSQQQMLLGQHFSLEGQNQGTKNWRMLHSNC